jgi:GNAT superfamily N-acetyltransferase
MLEPVGFSFVRWSHSSGGSVVPQYDFLFQHERAIDPQAVKTLYTTVGWWPERQEAEIAHVLSVDLAVGARAGTLLVGFARVVSDQHFRAFIEDVVVHPAYQRRGIGTLLLAKILDALQHIEKITVFCQPELTAFYEQHGFQASSSQQVLHLKGVCSTLPSRLHKQSLEKRM